MGLQSPGLGAGLPQRADPSALASEWEMETALPAGHDTEPAGGAPGCELVLGGRCNGGPAWTDAPGKEGACGRALGRERGQVHGPRGL